MDDHGMHPTPNAAVDTIDQNTMSRSEFSITMASFHNGVAALSLTESAPSPSLALDLSTPLDTCDTSPSSAPPTLPFELVKEVLSYIKEDKNGVLAPLCLVSHMFNSIATKQLYGGNLWLIFPRGGRPCDTPDDRNFKLQRTLVARPDLASMFKSLCLSVKEEWHTFPDEEPLPSRQPALDLLATVVELATNVTRVLVGPGCSSITLKLLLGVILSNPSLSARLTSLRVESYRCQHLYELREMLKNLPALTDVQYRDMTGWHYGPLTTFKTNAELSNSDLGGLAPSRETLSTVRFWTGKEDYPDWTPFTKLKNVTITINWQAEQGETNQILETCLVAETIKVLVDSVDIEKYNIAEWELLDSIPSSIVNLDIAHAHGHVKEYTIDWIRDGASQWPHLRELTVMRAAEHMLRWKSESGKKKWELEQECEEACAERGIRLRWTPFHEVFEDFHGDEEGKDYYDKILF